MNKVKILDCTLRDGGYVNNWKWGKDASIAISSLIDSIGVEYIELGMLRKCSYQEGTLVFDTVNQAADMFSTCKTPKAVMVELGGNYPLDEIPNRNESGIDMIRVMIWKRMLKEGLEYCRALINKGYDVGIQPTRTDEYTVEEFAELVRLYNTITPKALYVVDSFGVMQKDQILSYMKIADEILDEGITIGYHAHNNMQQAFTNAVAVAERTWRHNIMLDATVWGMGRGAGNLSLELITKYLNENELGSYNMLPIYEVAEKYLKDYYNSAPWGYRVPFMLSAMYGRNPTLAGYMEKIDIPIPLMEKTFRRMKELGVGIKYEESVCDEIINDLLKEV